VIHLDANLLIALLKDSDTHRGTAKRVLEEIAPIGCSSVAWMELHSRPVHRRDTAALKTILHGGIFPFDEAAASLAGELFSLTGSNRRTRLDTMIAATAILAGAELATVNADDFAAFVPHGLVLHTLP